MYRGAIFQTCEYLNMWKIREGRGPYSLPHCSTYIDLKWIYRTGSKTHSLECISTNAFSSIQFENLIQFESKFR